MRILVIRSSNKLMGNIALFIVDYDDELTLTMKSIALIARKAGTREAAQCVGTMCEHIARSIFALVLICNGEIQVNFGKI